jgi:hypothetical protein
MASNGDSALVLLRSLWEKHVLLQRPQMFEAHRTVAAEMSRRGLAVSGYALDAQTKVAAAHLEAVLRATLKDFQEHARPDRATRRYVNGGDAQKHLQAMISGEVGIAFGKPGPKRAMDGAHLADACKQVLLHIDFIVEAELGVISHKLQAPALDRRFWAEKWSALAIAALLAAAGWAAKVVVDSPTGQNVMNAVLDAIGLK